MKKLTLYIITYLSVAIFFALLFLAIFLPAGRLNFWNGWLYWLVFCIPTFMITAYFLQNDPALIERRIRPAETRPAQIVGQSMAAILFFGGIIILPSLDYRFEWSFVPPWISMLGAVVVFGGFVIVFIVFKSNTFASRSIEHMEGQQVIFTGLYSIVRHPMYSGAILIIFATPVVLGSVLGLIPAVLLFFIIVLRIHDEEKMLKTELIGYKEYCEKVRFRLIPYVW